MIKEVLLVCALALPPNKIEDYKLLVTMAKSFGAEKIYLRKGIHLVPEGSEKQIFKWKGKTVYFKKSA